MRSTTFLLYVSFVLCMFPSSGCFAAAYRSNEIPINRTSVNRTSGGEATIMIDPYQFTLLVEDLQNQVYALQSIFETLNNSKPLTFDERQINKIFASLNLSNRQMAELLDAPAIKSSYRGVNLNENQFKQLIASMSSKHYTVNVTSDRSFITQLIWGSNFTKDGGLGSFFDGLLADIGQLLSSLAVDIIEPVIKTLLKVVMSLIPVLKEFVEILVKLVKFLLCLIVNFIVFIDDHFILFEYSIFLILISYYITNYLFILLTFLLLVLLVGFDRSTPSIFRAIVESTLSNASCTIYS
jgi:hypothetical protein